MTSNRVFAKGRHRRTGFTMVEMLTVIGIIVILVAILLPVVSKVRLQVRVATTRQQMSKIAGAIDQYYIEFNHAYPGPFSNVQITNGSVTITNVNGGSVKPTSTENMVLGLCGGLELPNGTLPPSYNSNDILSSLGPLNLNPNITKQTRHVAFIDATPSQQMPDAGNTTAGAAWDAASGSTGITGTSDSTIPEFMDKFNSYGGGMPRPILYLRAQGGNPVNAGNTSTAQISDSNGTSTQYNYMHLIPYQGPNDFYQFPGSSNTSNDVTQAGTNTSYAPWVVKGTTAGTNAATTLWDTYLGNPNQFTSPRGVNAYILISAGADGIFGTQDDLFYP